MLLNYSTTVSADRTVGEIMGKLAKAGARQILQDFDENGNPSAISFRIDTKFGQMTFRLPANIREVQATLERQKVRSYRTPQAQRTEQAARVGWRILKDWIEAQLALLETGMVTVEQVFLAYAQNATGQTIYEALIEKKFTGLALPSSEHSKVVQMK